jgi:hypothetical protein
MGAYPKRQREDEERIDNSGEEPRLIAYCDQGHGVVVNNSAIWHNIEEIYGGKGKT